MTETSENQTPAPASAPKAEEAAEKVQEMGKKFTGFLGNLAEKAKNIDVKELAERAKSKVDEVKDKANELTAGKTTASVTPREQTTAEQMKEIVQKILPTMTAPFAAPAEIVLADMLAGEPPVVRLPPVSEGAAALVLTASRVISLVKSGEQYGAEIIPVRFAENVQIVPPRGDTAGRFVIKTPVAEIKIAVPNLDVYASVLLFYKKLREAGAK